MHEVGYPNAVSLLGDVVSREQESLLTALASDSRKVRLFVSPGATRDELLRQLSAELYVRVASTEQGLPRSLSDEELKQLFP